MTYLASRVTPMRLHNAARSFDPPHNVDYGDSPGVLAGREDLIVEEFLAPYNGHTRAAYRGDLADFFNWCRTAGLRPLRASRGDIGRYLEHLDTIGRSRATIARRLVTLRGFYEQAIDAQIIASSPTTRIRYRRPRSHARIQTLAAYDLARLLMAADEASPRTAALIWLISTTGLRISEACNARREDIRPGSDSRPQSTSSQPDAALRPGEWWLDVNCKGHVRRSVPLLTCTLQRMSRLPGSPQTEATAQGIGEGPLFATRTGNALDRRAAARDMQHVARQAGLSTPFSPHTLRHTFVTLARQVGCPLEDVQDAVGHADPATTRRYDHTHATHQNHPGIRIIASLTIVAASCGDPHGRS